MSQTLDNLLRQWTRAGAGFNVAPADKTPDLERLLLDTARHGRASARLFIMAATWLSRYGELIARHRLKRLIHSELEPDYRPTLGLLLDIAQQGTHPPRFASLLTHIETAPIAEPLFDVVRRFPSKSKWTQRHASAISRRWNRWTEPFDLKFDALRPPVWVMAHNPSFLPRADFRGDLRASILAALVHDPAAGDSELALARAAGGSRAQSRHALDNLVLTGRVQRTPHGRRTRITRSTPHRDALLQ